MLLLKASDGKGQLGSCTNACKLPCTVQVMLELTAGVKHLDYFVRWSHNYNVKPMPNCKGSRQVQLRVTDRINLLRGMYMLQPADAHERLTCARL